MAGPGEEKLQEIRDARDAITAGVDALSPSTPQEALQHVFAIAHGEGLHRVQTNLVQQVREGTFDFDQLSLRVDGAAVVMLRNHIEKTKQAQASRTRYLLALLDSLELAAADYEAAKADGAEAWAAFTEKYGDRETILETFFTEEEREGLETDEDIQRALVEKYLNEDGTVKEGFEHLLEAEDIAALQKWHRMFESEEAYTSLKSEANQVGYWSPDLEVRARELGVEIGINQLAELVQEGDPEPLVDAIESAKIETRDEFSAGGFSLSEMG